MKTLLRLLGFLRAFMAEMILAILLGTGVVAAGVGLLGTSAYLIAAAALHPSVGVLQVAIVGVRFFGLSRGILRYLERLVSHSLNFRLLKKLRVWLYTKIEPLAPAGLVDARGGDLLARMVGDIETLENFYVRVVSPPLVLLIVTIGMSWFAGRYSPLAGCILAAGLLLAGGGAAGITYVAARRFGNRVTAARAEISVELLDGIQGMAELVAFGQEGAAAASLHAASLSLEQSNQHLARAGAFGGMVSGLTANLTLWTILLVTIPLVRAGGLDGISLAVLVLISLASFEAAAPLSLAAQHLQSALQSARRLFKIADAQPVVLAPDETLPVPSRPHIQIEDLTFRYEADAAHVLIDFNLDLPIGKRVGILGPSGAGKTTLANLLLRFWDCPPGSIRLDGMDLRLFDPDEVRQVVSLVPQSAYLFSGTLRQNLLLARPEAAEEELRSALVLAGLDALVSAWPAGLDTWLGSQGELLSGGERQRVTLARAMLQNPAVMVLDEPTAGLDPRAALDFLDTLRETSPGHTLLMITHDLTGLDWLDEILVLIEGRVLERGSPAELARSGGWYAHGLELRKKILVEGEL